LPQFILLLLLLLLQGRPIQQLLTVHTRLDCSHAIILWWHHLLFKNTLLLLLLLLLQGRSLGQLLEVHP
jgi:hypothetical protein